MFDNIKKPENSAKKTPHPDFRLQDSTKMKDLKYKTQIKIQNVNKIKIKVCKLSIVGQYLRYT